MRRYGQKKYNMAQNLEDNGKMSIFGTSEMTNPVFSAWE
jgi:hypothetical protein